MSDEQNITNENESVVEEKTFKCPICSKLKNADWKTIAIVGNLILTTILTILVIITMCHVFNPSVSGGGHSAKKPSEYKVGADYNKSLKKNKPMLVLFYADWCGYCQRFMPIFENTNKKYGKKFAFTKVNVEDPKYADLVQEMEIHAYPTVYIIDKQNDKKVHIDNYDLMTSDSLAAELDKYLSAPEEEPAKE